MNSRAKSLRGTTLVELLVAVVFLSACAAIILNSVSSSSGTLDYAKRRMQVLEYLQDKLDSERASARTAALSTGTGASTVSLPTFASTVTVTQTVSLVPGFASLYDVLENASWTEISSAGPRSDSLQLESFMEAPDA